MRRLLSIAAALFVGGILCLGIEQQSHAQFGGMLWKPASGCSGSQWNAADKGVDVTLSGSPCKLTVSGGDPTNDELVRGTSSKSGTATSYAVKFTLNTVSSADTLGIGVARSDAPLGPTSDPFCGSNAFGGGGTANSTCYYPFSGTVYRGGTLLGTIFTAASGDDVIMEIDMSGTCSAAWSIAFNKNGGAYSNLGANTLPDTSGSTIYVAANVRNNNATATVDFAPTPPACASAWN